MSWQQCTTKYQTRPVLIDGGFLRTICLAPGTGGTTIKALGRRTNALHVGIRLGLGVGVGLILRAAAHSGQSICLVSTFQTKLYWYVSLYDIGRWTVCVCTRTWSLQALLARWETSASILKTPRYAYMSTLRMHLCRLVKNRDCHVVYGKRLTVTRFDSFQTIMLLVKICIRWRGRRNVQDRGTLRNAA